MKLNLLCVLVAGSVLMVACADYDIKSEEALSVIRQSIQRGNDIVIAIEAYNNKHGRYPERLEQLVPGFLRVIPETGISAGDRDRYRYHKFPDDADKPYRYHLLFILPDPGPGILALSARSWKLVTFNPAQLYDDTDVETTHFIIDGWAVQTLYRASHYKQQHEN